jgi:hypothetical protein
MFVTDRGECKKTGHDINLILSSNQYNTEYPGLLRSFVNDYYFDEIINWSLDGQKSYEELINQINSFDLVDQLSQNTYRYVTKDVEYIWVTDNNEITIILEVGKRNVCYLKNIVKLDDSEYFPELFILLTNIYSKLLMPFDICKQEVMNHEIDNSDFCGMSYCLDEYSETDVYIFRFKNKECEIIGSENNPNSLAILCKNRIEWRVAINLFMMVTDLLNYTKIQKEIVNE